MLDPRGDTDSQAKRDKCLDFLNHYELIAIASRAGIIDETFYRQWMGPAYIRDWNGAIDLVRSARSPRLPGDVGGSQAFSEFERLAVKWGGSRLQ